MGGELTVELLVDAYSQGIFPWPDPAYPMLWFSPPERGVLDFDLLHVPKSLQRLQRKGIYEFTVDRAFKDVITHCAQKPRPGQKGTWILPEMISAYTELFQQGYATSLEAWRNGTLVGGIYGVKIGGYVSAESMFGHEANVSKLCLVEWVSVLSRQGYSFLDIQMVTSVTKQFGGRLISRDEFLSRIS